MTAAKKKTSKSGRAKARPTYRGIRLQSMAGLSRFSPEQVRRAVEAALAKNADALARKT
jgi:hypothetical protein